MNPALPEIAVMNEALAFRVGRVFCVAKNYREHAVEMGGDPDRIPPRFFTKTLSSVLAGGGRVAYPRETEQLDHEVEWVIAIGFDSSGPVAPDDAQQLIYGVACGVDLTRRDLQRQAKHERAPWDLSKSFTGSAAIGAISKTTILPTHGKLRFWVDDELRQNGNIEDMIWSGAEVVAQLSRYEDLRAGDLVFTGTPAGVGSMVRGQTGRGEAEGIGTVSISIV